MGNLSRILAVTTAVLSVAFMGFAVVTTRVGGPNWQSFGRSLAPTPQDPAGYVLTETTGAQKQYTATSTTGDAIKTSAIPPDVIVAAYDHKIAAVNEELTALGEEQPQLEQRKAGMEAAIAADEQALAQAVAAQRQYLEQLRQQYSTLSQQVVQKTEEGRSVEQVVEARRTDVFRLQNQLEVLKADDSRIGQIEQQMLDLIRQIDADLAKAERRQEQLTSRLSGGTPQNDEDSQPAPDSETGN